MKPRYTKQINFFAILLALCYIYFSKGWYIFHHPTLSSCVEAAYKVSPDWLQKTMTCHSLNCFSIAWGQG